MERNLKGRESWIYRSSSRSLLLAGSRDFRRTPPTWLAAGTLGEHQPIQQHRGRAPGHGIHKYEANSTHTQSYEAAPS
jgi:hypothetical protein